MVETTVEGVLLPGVRFENAGRGAERMAVDTRWSFGGFPSRCLSCDVLDASDRLRFLWRRGLGVVAAA